MKAVEWRALRIHKQQKRNQQIKKVSHNENTDGNGNENGFSKVPKEKKTPSKKINKWKKRPSTEYRRRRKCPKKQPQKKENKNKKEHPVNEPSDESEGKRLSADEEDKEEEEEEEEEKEEEEEEKEEIEEEEEATPASGHVAVGRSFRYLVAGGATGKRPPAPPTPFSFSPFFVLFFFFFFFFYTKKITHRWAFHDTRVDTEVYRVLPSFPGCCSQWSYVYNLFSDIDWLYPVLPSFT